MLKRSKIKAILFVLLLATPAAQAVVINFESFGVTTFQQSSVVNDKYNSADFGELTISATNLGNNSGVDHPDLAVAFDSGLSSTRDPDLEAPFFPTQAELDTYRANVINGVTDPTVGLNPFNPGNILIIQKSPRDAQRTEYATSLTTRVTALPALFALLSNSRSS